MQAPGSGGHVLRVLETGPVTVVSGTAASEQILREKLSN